VVAAAVLWLLLQRRAAEVRRSEERRESVAAQLDRRIAELFSLQELSYVLSESIALERVVEQVARYAVRFLQADGAIVVLADDTDMRVLRVAAAVGSLESLQGVVSEEVETALVRFAIGREKIEVAQGVAVPSVNLFAGQMVRSAAVTPLRAHGTTMGALAVVDRQGGPFTTEDLWLLSTVAMQTSVVLANSRLYEMVRRSTEEWETAFNALAEGIAVLSAEGRIQRANAALARLAGLGGISETALVERDFTEAVFGESEAIDRLVRAALEGEHPVPLVVRSEQLHRTLRVTAAPLGAPDDGGSLVVLVEDVTEQRAMESQLIQNEKMASIGQLVSGVAHELNNPLTSIRGLAELLLERGPGPDFPKEHLRVIYDQAERAGRIVRNLLTFARKGTPDKVAVDLNDVVSRTALLIAYELRLRGIELESRLSDEPVPVLGDRYELQQVLLNLVTNAVQAVSDLEQGLPRIIVVETERAGDQVTLRVRDSGPGVPQQFIPYLFTPFFTTKGAGQGTGLGLSLSYGLVEAHGGRLTYAPGPEGGAEFTVNLPFLRDAGDAVLDRVSGAIEAPRLARRILVVDDDPAVSRVLNALFAPDGHTVEVARGGDQGLRMAAERDYDLLIADAGASTGGGRLFVTELLDSLPVYRRRLLVAGAARGSAMPSLAYSTEPLRWVQKPFNLRELRTQAAEVFG
jgi:two-component system NtrC family sensor kinase